MENQTELLINDIKSNNSDVISNKQIEEMALAICKSRLVADDDDTCRKCRHHECCLYEDIACGLYKAGYRKMPDNIGEFSDGYHTFNELYHHRAVLFSVICNMFPEKAWKSKLHDTGDMFDGMFIVGIETGQGQATYHYDIDPYWDMFTVKELEKAPKWDGHTPSDAIDRIGNISAKGYRKQSEKYLVKENGDIEPLNKQSADVTDINVAGKSEWISVDERLPEPINECLVAVKTKDPFGKNILAMDIAERVKAFYSLPDIYDYKWATNSGWEECEITHWMPLPEPPKMKGGAER